MLEAFLQHAHPRTIDPADREPLRALIERAVAEGRRAWPALEVPTFPAVLGAHFGRGKESVSTWFERLRPGDLWLASACALSLPGAASAFETAYRQDLLRAARRAEGPRHPAEDLVQLILEKLLVGSAERGPRLAEYSGQGHLQNWLRVAAVRICLDAVKSGAQHKREQGTDALEAADLSDDIELDFIKNTYRTRFKAAFGAAVQRLDSTERTLLKLSVLHGLSIDEIGALFHIHRATAARRVARARQSLLDHTRAALREDLSVRDDELDSIIGLIHSRLEVSLERLLRTTLD